ncbi:MAG: hypothetical protein M1837_005717 [Sclerophora amabilis]|nr:MAG: hypothetical protein M1837_005717 [Sclerophora amabilis]
MDFVHYQAPSQSEDRPKPASQERDDSRNHSSSVRSASTALRGEKKVDAELGSGSERRLSANNATMGAVEEIEESELSTRPRLTQDQVWMLEKQFQAHPKPNSNTKRQLAESTGLSLPRVANWFQNRRAKAKQQKRQEEFEILQTLEAAGRPKNGEPASPDLYFPPDLFSSELDLTPRHSTMGDPLAHPHLQCLDSSFQPFRQEPLTRANFTPFPSSLAAMASSLGQVPPSEPFGNGRGISFPQSHDLGFPYSFGSGDLDGSLAMTSSLSDWGSSADSLLSWTSTPQFKDPFNDGKPGYLRQGLPLIQEQQLLDLDGSSDPRADSAKDNVPALGHQIKPDEEQQSIQSGGNDFCLPALPDHAFGRRDSSSELVKNFSAVEIQSSHEGGPPEQSIAARRKRPTPAALMKPALRSHSHVGTITGSPTAKGPFLSTSPTVRRIKSLGGNLNVMHGRIQKPSPGSAQRSPLNIASFVEAGAFNEPNSQHLTPPMSISTQFGPSSSSLAPPTPLSPMDLKRLQGDSSSSNELGTNEQDFIFSSEYQGSFIPTSVETEPTLASPPTTPHDSGLFPYQHQMSMIDYSAMPSADSLRFNNHHMTESPMISPQFPAYQPHQLHMPQPIYASPISCGDPEMMNVFQQQKDVVGQEQHQGQIRPEANAGGDGKLVPEFFFEDPSPKNSRPAPPPLPSHQPKQKNYIFANQTPDDF